MPLLAVRVSEKIYESIKELIEAGRYANAAAFLEVAAMNQLALENGGPPADGGADPERAAKRLTSPSAPISEAHRSTARTPARAERRSTKPGRARFSSATFIVQKARHEEPPLEVFSPFALHPEMLGTLTPANALTAEAEHIFGQVNRLFPIKVACRGIANMAFANQQTWPDYSFVHDVLGENASKLGSLLEKWDHDHDRKRDELLATGLPKRGNSASRDRFVSQLIARVTRSGSVYVGALCQYALAVLQEQRVALTAQGLEFALMPNPILDRPDPQSTTSLSQEEIKFLIRQIVDSVPTESEDMRAILEHISNGKKTPADLNDVAKNIFPTEWTDGLLATHVSGLIARLADLSLVRRRWEGRYVTYELGDGEAIEGFTHARTGVAV